jgi:hypothetical protein
MLHRFVTAGTVAGTTLLSPLTGVASAAPSGDDAPEPEVDNRECVVDTSQGTRAQPEVRCYPTLQEALRATNARGAMVVATHYKGGGGGGEYIHQTGTSCSDTWIPPMEWRYDITSTRVSQACSGAKHYTGSNCSGTYQIVSQPYPTVITLGSQLNNNVGCIKYA